MSVWSINRLAKMSESLANLQIHHLEGSGQLNLAVQDYLEIADKVASKTGNPFQIQIEWRSGDDYVTEPWRKWRDAHAQVEMVESSSNHFPPEFRDLVVIVAKRKESIIPPEKFAAEN